jgi:hypothetical protein
MIGFDTWKMLERDSICRIQIDVTYHRLWLWGARRGVIIRQEWHPDFRSSLLDGKILGSWDDNASVEWIIVRRDVVCGLGGELGSLPSSVDDELAKCLNEPTKCR